MDYHPLTSDQVEKCRRAGLVKHLILRVAGDVEAGIPFTFALMRETRSYRRYLGAGLLALAIAIFLVPVALHIGVIPTLIVVLYLGAVGGLFFLGMHLISGDPL